MVGLACSRMRVAVVPAACMSSAGLIGVCTHVHLGCSKHCKLARIRGVQVATADLLLDSQECGNEGLVDIAVKLSPNCNLLQHSIVFTLRAPQRKVASSCVPT